MYKNINSIIIKLLNNIKIYFTAHIYSIIDIFLDLNLIKKYNKIKLKISKAET